MSLTTTMYTIEYGHTFHMMVSHRSSECLRRSDYVVLCRSVEDSLYAPPHSGDARRGVRCY